MKTRTMLGGLIFVAACGGGGGGVPPNTPTTDQDTGPEPTEGICVRSALPAGTPLDVASAALDRGCPRLAADVMQSIAPAALSREDRFKLAVYKLEAKEDAQTEGYDRRAPVAAVANDTELASEPWMRATDPEIGLFGDANDIWKGLGDGSVTKEDISTPRYARAFIRATFANSCLLTQTKDLVAPLVEHMNQARLDYFKTTGISADSPPEVLREFERAALWSCNQTLTTDAAKSAIAHANKRTEPPDDAFLDLVETYFPGARVGDLGVGAFSQSERYDIAALEIAARRGAGDLYDTGAEIEQALTAGKLRPTGPSHARSTWIRAVAALRARRDPESAKTIATDGIKEAIANGRADLVDANRVVLLFAAAEQGDFTRVRELVKLLDRSFTARGTPGARLKLSRQMVFMGRLWVLEGHADEALDLNQAAVPLADRLPLMQGSLIYGSLPAMLLEGGRFEEALAATNHFSDRIDHASGSFTQLAPAMRKIVADNRSEIQRALGLPVADTDPQVWRRMMNAIARGDRAAIDKLDAEASSGTTDDRNLTDAGLMLSGYCSKLGAARVHALGATFKLAASLRHSAQSAAIGRGNEAIPESLGLVAESASAAVYAGDVVNGFARCAVVLHDPTILTDAQEYLKAVASQMGGIDPLTVGSIAAASSAARGNYHEAAELYAQLGRLAYDLPGHSATGGVGTAQRASRWFTLAAAAALSDSPPDTKLAVQLIEESRGRDLRAARAARPNAGEAGDVAAIEAEIAKLQGDERALSEAGGNASATQRDGLKKAALSIESKLRELEAKRSDAVQAMRARSPAAYAAAALAPPLDLRQVQARLRDDETVVYFLVLPEDAWAVLVDAKSARAVRLAALDGAKNPALALGLSRYPILAQARAKEGGRGLVLDAPSGASVDTAAPDALADVAADLYARAIAPIESAVPAKRRLLIVPDASTAPLPFAALGNKRSPWSSRNPLRVIPGAYLLPEKPEPRSRGGALVVGDPDFGERAAKPAGNRGLAALGRWPSLPGTRVEATAVAGLYGVKPFLGKEATEERVREAMPSAAIIHFATHGLADVSRPPESTVVFAMPPAGSKDDGFMHAYEVEPMRLVADIVVLSACETGRGQSRGTEGVLALDRSFLVAGAKSVLSTLWVVDDETTASLMTAFHTSLKGGAAADVALADAIESVRQKKSDPYYWSGFRLIGSGLR